MLLIFFSECSVINVCCAENRRMHVSHRISIATSLLPSQQKSQSKIQFDEDKAFSLLSIPFCIALHNRTSNATSLLNYFAFNFHLLLLNRFHRALYSIDFVSQTNADSVITTKITSKLILSNQIYLFPFIRKTNLNIVIIFKPNRKC